MSQRTHAFVPGEFYHVYNRGTDKRTIFLDDADYRRFQVLLYLSNTEGSINLRDLTKHKGSFYEQEVGRPLVAIGAYCLMPNHYHLLVTPLLNDGLSRFLQKLATAYSMYFNKKYERTGTLFEGKFKSQIATEDRYLKYLFSYIHLNPIKLIQSDWKEVGIRDSAAAGRYLSTYKHSSYSEWVGEVRPEQVIVSKEPFPVYFESFTQAQNEIREWVEYSLGKT